MTIAHRSWPLLLAALVAGCASSSSTDTQHSTAAILRSGSTVAALTGPRPAPSTDRSLAGEPGGDELVIVQAGQTQASILVAPSAGPSEKLAAADLVKFIEMMSGAKPALADNDAAIAAALKSDKPLIFVGQLAVKQDASLADALAKKAKKNPVLRGEAVVLRRKGNRVYLAGTDDQSHYFAAALLLRKWGCRWYLPTDFGQCIPRQASLRVGKLDWSYAPPFEIRGYWISWNGSTEGARDFQLRNMMNDETVPAGHALGHFVKELIPEGKSVFNVAITDPKTADHVVAKSEAAFAKGQHISLSIEDGLYESDYGRDKEVRAELWDKYFLTYSLSDNFMEFYNNVARKLTAKYPQSKSKIGFLAYCNVTIPPQREVTGEKALVADLAPIDIDPNHSMNDPRSPPKREYREMMYRWSKVMEGRLFIYDYDQGMLVWRDLPNPVVQFFKEDAQHYRKAGILGIKTESRNAIATVFLNLHVRGWLQWDPDADVDALLSEFYRDFYGPAAEPMADYWNTLHRAWTDSFITEHEYFTAAEIYTPAVVAALKKHLEAGESAMNAIKVRAQPLPTDWKQFEERMKFTRLSFNLIEQYTSGWRAASTDADFKKAVEWGDKAIATRYEIADMNTTFTTCVSPKMPAPENVKSGPAWLLGEIEQYRQTASLTDGTKGKLVAKLPVDWMFRRDPNDAGLSEGWAYQKPDMTYWKEHGAKLTGFDRKDWPTTQWEMLGSDAYAQAQGVLHPDAQSFTGFMYYKAFPEFSRGDTEGKVRLHFPGLFGEAWLYINGHLVAYRPQKPMWWHNDYAFSWDVDLASKLKPGVNDVTLRVRCQHHVGGMFRRPFVYRAN